MKLTTIFLLSTGIALSGCSTFTPPREKPLLTESFKSETQDKNGFVLTATDANRRVAIIDLFSGHVCVEPPPEAANTISEAVAALFEANVKDKGNLGASLSQSISQNISQLYKRTQTVQLYRDAVFALCQSSINGSIVISEYTKAPISEEKSKQVLNAISTIKNKEKFSAAIDDLNNKNLFSLKTIDALDVAISEIQPTEPDNKTKSDELAETKSKLLADLQKAEFRRRLEDGLSEAFDLLKIELPLFYQAEKLRFMVELGKPIQVCRTEYEQQKDSDGKQIIKQVLCEAKIPENIDKVIKEYVLALPSVEKQGQNH